MSDLFEPFRKDTLSEREVRLLMKRINDGRIKPGDDGLSFPYKLTDSQVEKGRKWLMNLWKSPRGVERKNNPYGYREQEILDNFKTIEFVDVYSERGNYYYPYYRVYSTKGNYMEYYVSGGEVHILG